MFGKLEFVKCFNKFADQLSELQPICCVSIINHVIDGRMKLMNVADIAAIKVIAKRRGVL